MGMPFRSHNLSFKGPNMVWWWPGLALHPFRAAGPPGPRAIYILQFITMSLRPNDTMGTREGSRDTVSRVEASLFLLIFSEYPHVLEYPHVMTEYPHVRQLCGLVVARQRHPRRNLASGRP